MAATVVGICNRALQKLGAAKISSLEDGTKNARACNNCYEPVRDGLLRSHAWNFSIARAELPAESPAPDWGRGNAFLLPNDFIRLLPAYAEWNYSRDFVIEGRYILTNDTAPLQIRYVAQVTDPQVMDPLFRELLSQTMAIEMCEELTQSNTKKQALSGEAKGLMAEARRANAFENPPAFPPEDSWVSLRGAGKPNWLRYGKW